MREVTVRLRAQRRNVLAVLGARQALVVADHIPDLDLEAASQPPHQPQVRGHLLAIAHHLSVAVADVLDSDRGPVQPNRVAAHHAEPDELMDHAVYIDY